MEHLFMTSVKGTEYLIAVAFLLAFMVFWSLLSIGKVPTIESLSTAASKVRKKVGEMVDWFLVPQEFYFHPGHTWVKREDNDTVRVGMDDFAQKLAGKIENLHLPKPGSFVHQGEKGWTLQFGPKSVDVLSPMDGEIIAVNETLRDAPEQLNKAPYGTGWLMRIKSPRVSSNLKNLMSGSMARKWMEEVSDTLRTKMDSDLGLVYQDGGLPIEGIAKSLAPEKWDEILKEFFLTSEEPK